MPIDSSSLTDPDLYHWMRVKAIELDLLFRHADVLRDTITGNAC